MLLGVSVPVSGSGTLWRSAYVKAMDRKVWAFAQAGVAIAVRVATDTHRVLEARVALGGVAPVPVRARGADAALVDAALDAAAFRRAADAALVGATPLKNNAYKLPLIRGLFAELATSLAS
jgi:xanthine dehydrogenase YagS FAD-binding subunit